MGKYFVENMPLKGLKVDGSYQRDVRPAWVKKLTENYDDALVRPLVLSERSDGSLFKVDGNHTSIATINVKGEDAQLPAIVHTGLTVEQEAKLFVQLNSSSKTVNHNEKFKADITAQDAEALEYKSVLDESGIRWGFTGGGNCPVFRAHNIGMQLFRLYGRTVLLKAFQVLRDTSSKDLCNGKLLGGICYILANTNANTDNLVQALNKATMDEIVKKTHYYGSAGHNTSSTNNRLFALAILDFYNKGRRKGKIYLAEVTSNGED